MEEKVLVSDIQRFSVNDGPGYRTNVYLRGIHCCLDTNGHCDWEVLLGVSESADIVLYDLKHMDPEAHRRETGVDNRIILRNLVRRSEAGTEYADPAFRRAQRQMEMIKT